MAQKLALGLLALCVAIQMTQADDVVTMLFNTVDTNDDGELTQAEVNTYLETQEAAGLVTSDQIKSVNDNFVVADGSENGSLDLTEFSHAVKLLAAK